MSLIAYSAALLVGLGLAAALRLSIAVAAGLSVLALGTLAVLAAREVQRPRRGRVVALGAILGLAGGLSLAPRASPSETILDASAAHLRGVVERSDGDSTVVRTDAGLGVSIRGVDLPSGAVVELDAAVASVARFRNPSPHPAWPGAGSTDVRVTELRRLETIEPASAASRLAHSIRRALRTGLVASLDSETAGIARALVLGDARAAPDDVELAIRGAGLSHVLAVSGMHVTLVVGSLAAFLRWLLLRFTALARRVEVDRVASALAIPLALAYAELAGGAPSAWRASTTATLAFSLRAMGRRPHAGTLCAACIVPFAAIDPEGALSPAFVLSIVATAAVLDPAPPGTAAIVAVTRASVRATVATAPVVLWCFGGTPLVGVIANVVVVPFACALLLPLALVHAALAALGLPGGGLSAALLSTTSRAFVAASDAFGAAPLGRDLSPPDVVQGIALGLAVVALFAARSLRARLVTIALLLVALAGAELALEVRETGLGHLRVTFLDVGQGDAALVDLPDGRLVLVDAGGSPNGGADPGARVIVPLLRARRRTRIDLAIVTHPHPDHFGGLSSVAARVPITELWDTGQANDETPDGTLAALLGGLSAHGTRIRRPASVCTGARVLARVRLDVLSPCPAFDPGWDPNDNSFVVRLRYGARTFLFAGDAEAHTEATLAGRVGHADVLKVAHHGSRTSSSAAWLAEVRPWLAVVSAGHLNRFGHPHAEIAERLRASATHVARTDEDGGVVVESDGAALRFDTWSGRSGQLVE